MSRVAALERIARASSDVIPELFTHDELLNEDTCLYCGEFAGRREDIEHGIECPVGELVEARNDLSRAVQEEVGVTV